MSDLDAIRERHRPMMNLGGAEICDEDYRPWPCDAAQLIAALDARPVGLGPSERPSVRMSSRTPRQVLVLLPAIGKDGRCSACGAVPSRETGNCRCPVKIDVALASEPQPSDDEWVKEQLRRYPKRPPVGLASEPQP